MILPAPAVRLLVLASALVLDLSFGELPNCLHPVAGMGTFIRAWVRRAPADGAVVPWLFGAALTMSGIVVFSLLWFLLSQAGLPSWLWVAIGALGLKAVIALHRLLEAAGEVERALQSGDLTAARRSVGWNSVSRETDDLDVGHVASAAVESLAENPVDILVAPVLAYTLDGLRAGWAYGFVQTTDAMIGYRDPRREFLRKFAARLDDVLNWILARLAGLLVVPAGAMAGGDWRMAWRVMLEQHGRTSSPNAGWPMAAAGALGVRLEKAGAYRLDGGAEQPGWETIRRARQLVAWAAGLGLLVCSTVTVVVGEAIRRV
jgi:adenosylcobinamide-phosphate synthase